MDISTIFPPAAGADAFDDKGRGRRKTGPQTPPVLPRAAGRGSLRGAVNLVDAGRVVGWAQDADVPDAPVRLEILVAGKVVAHALADRYREELRRAGVGSGRHGFEAALPDRLGGTGTLEVRRVTDGATLDRWPGGLTGRSLHTLALAAG